MIFLRTSQRSLRKAFSHDHISGFSIILRIMQQLSRRPGLSSGTLSGSCHLSAASSQAWTPQPLTPHRAPDCPLRRDGHGSHLPLRLCRWRDGHGDEYPRRAGTIAHVDPGDDIGRTSEPAPTTAEVIPVRPIGPLGVAAARTALRGESRVHFQKWHPGQLGLVGEVLSELVERPGGCAPRWSRRSRTRSRMPPSASTAIPQPVRCATDTISLLIRWFTWQA